MTVLLYKVIAVSCAVFCNPLPSFPFIPVTKHFAKFILNLKQDNDVTFWVWTEEVFVFCICIFICLFICLCLPEQKVWTVVLHNTTNAVKVQGSSLERPHVMRFNYSASPDQLHVLVAGSDQCQQEVVYQCRKSRLFNHWGKSCQQHLVSFMSLKMGKKCGNVTSPWLDRIPVRLRTHTVCELSSLVPGASKQSLCSITQGVEKVTPIIRLPLLSLLLLCCGMVTRRLLIYEKLMKLNPSEASKRATANNKEVYYSQTFRSLWMGFLFYFFLFFFGRAVGLKIYIIGFVVTDIYMKNLSCGIK